MKSDFLTLVWMICVALAILLAIWLIIVCLRKYSNWRISKNSKQYFRQNKEICEKIKKEGDVLLKNHSSYLDNINHFNLNRIVRCSNSVVSGSSQDPIKYILKYSDIDTSLKDAEKLEFVSKYIVDYKSFLADIDDASDVIKKELPLF